MEEISAKYIIILIASCIMGLAFFITGFLFRSQKFINKLNDSTPIKSDENYKKNEFRAKGSSIVAFLTGGLTIIWSLILLFFPELSTILLIIYMIILIAAFIFLTVVFK